MPDLTGVHAVALTSCPLLAAHLADLHPGIRTGLTGNAGAAALPDTDAVLVLTNPNPDGTASSPADEVLRTTTVYIGTDLDDAGVWERAVQLRATDVLFSPSDDDELVAQVREHLRASA